MANEQTMLTKEEVHWSSFRSAVVCLQHTLSKVAQVSPRATLPDDVEHITDSTTDENSRQGSNNSAYRRIDSDHEPQSALDNDGYNETASHLFQPQYIISNSTQWGDTNNIETNSSHRQLELIGLEQVHNNNNSWNGIAVDIIDTDHLISPTHGGVPSHASHTTNALSIAEQQLAETRLKLAMTESERDELEFQLIQGS
ncbi:hypothetical protein ACHAWU_008440 [Discostella pseudostelligera]|uniref:Uncharacterized protein n=1 Tax=Discostella pseudostelligera TaxID=259834 RepID=A0ABD3LZU9_9STRA